MLFQWTWYENHYLSTSTVILKQLSSKLARWFHDCLREKVKKHHIYLLLIFLFYLHHLNTEKGLLDSYQIFSKNEKSFPSGLTLGILLKLIEKVV